MMILAKKKSKKYQFLIHPRAQDAYDFYLSITKRFKTSRLGDDLITSLFVENRTYHATQIGQDIYIFSGFELLHTDLKKIDLVHSTILIYNKKNLSEKKPDEITKDAWVSVLQSLFSSVDCSVAFAELHIHINKKIPRVVMKDLFSNSKLSEEKLANYVGSGRSLVAKQKKVYLNQQKGKFKDEAPLRRNLS